MRTVPAPNARPAESRGRLAAAAAVLAIALVACGGQEPDQAAAPADGGAGEAAEAVTFVAVDIAYDDAPDSLSAGSHTIELVNEGNLPHTVTFEELGDRDVVEVERGETATGEVELGAGTYTYYCSVPGHREAGMEGTLDVS